MSRRTATALCVVFGLFESPIMHAVEVSSNSLSLTPTFAPGYCAMVANNGYGGTDRQLFIPSVSGYYRAKDYSSVGTIWIITPEAFDPAQRLVDQALASNYELVETPVQTYLTAGTRVYIWAAYTGGYGGLSGCEADGASENVTMRIVGEDSGVPEPPTDLSASAAAGGAIINFTAGSDNGAAITNYEHGTFNEGEGRWSYTALSPADATSPITLTGYTSGVSYTVRLRAVNANGTSTDSTSISFTPSGTATDFVERLYQTILGRSSDPLGLAGWLEVLESESAARVALGFLFSPEFLGAGLSDEVFVDTLYRALFDREGDVIGTAHWVAELQAGRLREMIIYGFLRSQEFSALADSFGVEDFNSIDEANYQVRAFVERFYISVLERQPEAVGFHGWVTGLSSAQYSGGLMARSFFLSQEYLDKGTSDAAFVTTCYQAFFGREPDSAGLDGWLNLLALGESRASVLNGFSHSAEFALLASQYGISP